jgi:tetratricopeptide (TPR) repeat protein
MIQLLLVLATACDDDAAAGAAYRAALEALNQGMYEEAVGKIQESLRHQPRETDKLYYRDRDGRHKEAYYPHFAWAQVRALQARKETAAARRRELIRDGLVHLDLTAHPDAAALRDALRGELAVVEKALSEPAPEDAAVAALRDRIDQLCDREQFEDALRAQEAEKALLDRHPDVRTRLREMVESRRTTVLARYEKALELALERAALAPPLEDPEAIPIMLRGAALPRSVAEPVAGRFVWLRSFLSLCEERLPKLRSGAGEPDSADAFEKSAVAAVEAGTPAGFRAARNIAQAIRWSRIEPLAGGRNDAELEPLIAGALESSARCRKLLNGRKDLEGTLSTVVGSFEARVQRAGDQLAERKRFREQLNRWLAQSQETLGRPSTMADPDALRAAARSFDSLETHPAWPTAPSTVRAGALWTRGVLELIALLLEGEAVPAAVDRVAPRLKDARALDPAVAAAGERRLSPKLRDRIAALGR